MDNKALADAFDRCKAVQLATLKNLQEARALIFSVPAELTSTKPHQNTRNIHRPSNLATANQGETESTDDL